MSVGSESAAIGTLCQLCFCFMLYFSWQRSNLVNSSGSMRLRPRRTCSGVECFGGFHIKRFSNLFLFLRGGLT